MTNQSMSGERLKECPFCGGASKVITADGKYYVICTSGKCSYDENNHTTEETAIAAWNTRKQEPGRE